MPPAASLRLAGARRAAATFFLGYLTKETNDALRTKPPAERAQIVKNLALYAKWMVHATGFEKLHAAWIRESLNAADPNAAPPEPTEDAARGRMAAGLMQGMKDVPPEGLKLMIQSEVESLTQSKSSP